MKQKKTDNTKTAKPLADEELEAAAGGMKIVIGERPSFITALLRLIFKVKD